MQFLSDFKQLTKSETKCLRNKFNITIFSITQENYMLQFDRTRHYLFAHCFYELCYSYTQFVCRHLDSHKSRQVTVRSLWILNLEKMLKISWKDKVTNVLEKVKEERYMLNTIWQRKYRRLRNKVLLWEII